MPISDCPIADSELERVANWFELIPSLDAKFSVVLRQALDEVIDGGRTGRWSVDSLGKTEKTYIGTKVEILLKYDFGLPDGQKLDALVEGCEVDIKCTVKGNWMIPREAVGEICLLVRIDDAKSTFQVGLVRAVESLLTLGVNRDGKRALTSEGKKHIKWLVAAGSLKANFLATMPSELRLRILSHRSGQKRINELFRLVLGRIIDRCALETVARQLDPMKRMRDARKELAKEGILVLGHQDNDPAMARKHGVEVPKKGEAISVRKDIDCGPAVT